MDFSRNLCKWSEEIGKKIKNIEREVAGFRKGEKWSEVGKVPFIPSEIGKGFRPLSFMKIRWWQVSSSHYDSYEK